MNTAPDHIKRITVYASSSNGLEAAYYAAAGGLGEVLGKAGVEIVYGGGRVGLMGAMADRALAEGAHVHGVIPHFLNTVEHGHANLPRLDVVRDMRERKHRMIEKSDAVIALPGGSGTLEELLEGDIEFVPTYGNTLMGLACHKPFDPADNHDIIYHPPCPRGRLGEEGKKRYGPRFLRTSTL